ncbi:hypothetical protein NDA18_002274 [Ustilago nuda]|nr:hypothetical protein NDA18_002274 [Ustilago nuda]
MPQTRLDKKKSQDASQQNDDEQATAGSKRKETDPTHGENKSQDDNDDRAKSRKTETNDEQQDQKQYDSSTKQQGGNGEAVAAEPVKLSDDRQKVDNKLKGDDIEINKGEPDSDDKKSEVPWHVSEKGLIYFFYRPKVRSADKAESNSTKSLDDVPNTFMLLVPRASESNTAPAKGSKEADEDDKRKPPNPTAYRLVSLGKKRMPSPDAALKAGQEPGGIGGRHSEAIWATPPARPAGRGHCAMSIKKTDPPSSREVCLTYHLSHPSSNDFGQVQEELGLHPSSSVLMQMRNPTLAPTGPEAPPAGLPEDKRAILTKDELQENFGGKVSKKGKRYARPEEPSLLDRSGVELLLIKREQQEDGLKGLGDEQSEALAKLAKEDSEKLSDDAILKELKLSNKDVEVDALSGDWI